MFEHLAHPWILARIVLGAAAVALAAASALGAVRIFLAYRGAGAPPDERTLALERGAELLGTTLTAAFALELPAALLTVLASDRLAGSVRGAMCAYGVFHADPWGARALAASALASAACAAWLAARRVDVRLSRGSLARTLAGGALVVCALLFADLAASAAFFLRLDLAATATCCSVFVDAASAGYGAIADAHTRARELGGALSLTLAAALAALALARRPSALRGALAGALGLGALAAALAAVTDVVAPFTYETPHHRCAYCLLRRDAAPAGPLLLAALAVAALCSVGALAVAPLVRRAGAAGAARDVLARLGRASALAWAVALIAAVYPVLRYAWVTGTLELFR